MKHAMLLDCTLRDGAYLIDKKFGENNINGIIGGLVKTGIDCIEIGFLQDDGFGKGKTVFKNAADAKRYIPQNKNGRIFTVLADYSRYSIENLDPCTGDSIDAVRECFFKEERFDAVENCRRIKEKGYQCFVQPVDILGYTDTELIEFLQLVNKVEPYCFSIVDTFGSMYQDDLHRVFELIHHNLVPTCKIGFHSHNNMQLSNALSQEFVRMTYGKREVIVDGTISGMGRGAGNTPTELIAQYLVSQMGYSYDMDTLLDIIDNYMDSIRSRCFWGYTTPYFLAGSYSAHVNNIAYLTQKNSIKNKDIRYILNRIGADKRKRYDYDLLEKTYLEYLESDVNDEKSLKILGDSLEGRNVLLLVPGRTVVTEIESILSCIRKTDPVVISVNFLHDDIKADFVYMSNLRRYSYWLQDDRFAGQKKIIASNIMRESKTENEIIVSFNHLVKCGWEHLDNSTIMLLRLLDHFHLKSVSIAGFDGYGYDGKNSLNYASDDLELSNVREDPVSLNKEISEMLADFIQTRTKQYNLSFITPSRFERFAVTGHDDDGKEKVNMTHADMNKILCGGGYWRSKIIPISRYNHVIYAAHCIPAGKAVAA